MRTNPRGFIGLSTLILIVLGFVIVGGVGYVAIQNSGNSQTALEQLLPADTLEGLASESTNSIHTASQGTESSVPPVPLLSFIAPQSGAQINAVQGAKIQWHYADPSIATTFPNADTYIVLSIIDASGKVIGSFGDGTTISKTSASWNIASNLNQEFYTLTSGAQYKIRATLSYEPKDITCNPAVKGECDPIYSPRDQALRDKAKTYVSESGWFTVNLDGYVRPAAAIDAASLTFSETNSTIRGTSNMTALKLQIIQNSKYFVDTTVPVVSGTWSYIPRPALPNGEYSVQLWNTSGSVPFPSGSLTVQVGQAPQPSVSTYTNGQYGFSIDFLANDLAKTTGYGSLHPFDADPIVYSGYWITVNVSDKPSDLANCMEAGKIHNVFEYSPYKLDATYTKSINGVTFAVSDWSSDDSYERNYTTLRNGKCFDIQIVTVPTCSLCSSGRPSLESYKPQLDAMDTIAQTFRFISQ